MAKRFDRRLKALLQALLSGCLVVFVFRHLDGAQATMLAFHPQRISMLVGAFLAFNASKIVAALRLNIYQRHAAIHVGEGENLRLYYAGMFLNLFLPGGIGGDGYKVLVLHRSQGLPLRPIVTVMLADRASGVLALMFLLCLLMPVLGSRWEAPAATVFSAASMAAIVAVFVWGHRRLVQIDRRGLASVFALGLAVQCLQLICMGMLLCYLGTPGAHYLSYLAVFLMSSVAAVLPLSIGGLGVREATFLFGLGLLHLDPGYGVVAATWFFLVTALSSFIGLPFLGRFSLRPTTGKSNALQ